MAKSKEEREKQAIQAGDVIADMATSFGMALKRTVKKRKGETDEWEVSLFEGTTIIKDDKGKVIFQVEITPTHLILKDPAGIEIIHILRYMLAFLEDMGKGQPQ